MTEPMTETVADPVRVVLERWKAAFDGHQVGAMADLFTQDALFQGFGPKVEAGRDAVHAYYAAVPDDRTADVTVLNTYTIGEDAAGGFADVTFSDPHGWAAPVHLSLVLRREHDTWRIRQYHVSRVVTDH
ncbi:SgcJ/EcaC family oxidoreductase [Streptomyces chiangmaiensis]|uniref:SgcJ/EcaC family oxidoreductase n=1 Tax=Streptomyces chiangmaiensis TaxID=766497 RepID=A0ABU7FDL8_9ACTN|nr:SgcJ/EcaC family oxidoreductase [Streptomyces chiangmaiensis]MED7822046.1 SgcJ/EcaC family oxidoreductase [Streptomyces chiangmaiensis]